MNDLMNNSHHQEVNMSFRDNRNQWGSSINGLSVSHASLKKDGNSLPMTAMRSESLLGMALYDFDTIANDVGLYGGYGNTRQVSHAGNGVAPAFHPIEEYKDLSLKEILDLSDDFLHTEEDGISGLSYPNQGMFEPFPLLNGSGNSDGVDIQLQLQYQHQKLMQQQQQLQMLRQRQLQLQKTNVLNNSMNQSMVCNSDNIMMSQNNMGMNLGDFGMDTLRTVSCDSNNCMLQLPQYGHNDLSDIVHNNFNAGLRNDNLVSSSNIDLLNNSVLNDSKLFAPQVVSSGCDDSKGAKRSYKTFNVSCVTDEDDFIDELDDDDYNGADCFGEDRRFRPYQAGQWTEKFEELCQYRKTMGHCLVPHTYTENLALARWVKRQRYQYKLMIEGKSSTMTDERVQALEDIGFVWDSQGAAWGDRLHELQQFKKEFSHCNVPSNYCQNPRLATWIKCQRRQYKLYMENKPSNMTPQRIHELEKLGFEWELRSYKKARTN